MAILAILLNGCYYAHLIQKDYNKYEKLETQKGYYDDDYIKIYDTSVPENYFVIYYYFNKTLNNTTEIRDYLFSKKRKSNVYHKSIFGDEIIAAFNKDADYQAFFKEIFVDFKNNKTILGDDIVAHIKDPNYQAFLKQIVVEYAEERIDKKQ